MDFLKKDFYLSKYIRYKFNIIQGKKYKLKKKIDKV